MCSDMSLITGDTARGHIPVTLVSFNMTWNPAVIMIPPASPMLELGFFVAMMGMRKKLIRNREALPRMVAHWLWGKGLTNLKLGDVSLFLG
jgi:hypothetical protein